MPARPIAVSIFLILLLVAAVRAQDQKPPSFTNPEDDSDSRMRIESDTWVLPFPGVEIRVTYLEAGTHSIFLEERAPGLVDPFTRRFPCWPGTDRTFGRSRGHPHL